MTKNGANRRCPSSEYWFESDTKSFPALGRGHYSITKLRTRDGFWIGHRCYDRVLHNTEFSSFSTGYGPAATMKLLRITITAAAVMLHAACVEPPPPRTVSQFIEHPILLEAALVRCTRNRAESRYDAECVNAREAVMLTEAKADSNRRAELEAQSKRKRDALRNTQRAQAEARRRVAEAQRQREEAEYLAQFGVLPPIEEPVTEELSGNVPMAVIPDAQHNDATYTGEVGTLPEIGSNAPVMEIAPDEEPETDLESIRDELRRRNDERNER